MSTLGTGTLGSGTLGNPGTTSQAGGGRVRRNLGSGGSTPIRRTGRIDWVVTIDGNGELSTAAHLDTALSLTPTAAASTVDLTIEATSTLAASGRRDMHLDGASNLAAEHRLTLEPALTLRHITDPPELWDLLDLFELTP